MPLSMDWLRSETLRKTSLIIAIVLSAAAVPPAVTMQQAIAAGNPALADLIYDPVFGNVSIDSSEATGQIISNFILQNSNGVLPDFLPVALFPEEVNGTFSRYFTSITQPEEISWTDLQIFSSSSWASEIGLSGVYDLGPVFPLGLDAAELGSFLTESSYVGSLGTGAFQFDQLVVPDLTADFDQDGDVDGSDFLSWQRGFGTTSSVMLSDGDGNADGLVDGLDLSIWVQQFGPIQSQAFSIPEPSSFTVLVCVLAMLTWSRRRLKNRDQCSDGVHP